MSLDVDSLVIGGGMAGLTAASAASSKGCRVVLVEKAPQIGGSAALSGGVLWQPKDRETLRMIDPDGDPALVDVFFDRFPDALEWVRASGAHVGEPTGVLAYGVGRIIDVLGYFQVCQRGIEKAGGHVVVDAMAERLSVDASGNVVGAVVRDRDGLTEITAPTTVLATGGFHADPALRAQYLGENARSMLVRGNAASAGDGLKLGRKVGAATSECMSGFYGHPMTSPLKTLPEAQYILLSQYYSTHSVVVNLAGQRVVDESRGYAVIAQAAVRQREPRLAVLFDQVIKETLADGAAGGVQGLDIMDRFAESRRAGGHTATADNWRDVGTAMAEWGFDADATLDTLRVYNAAAAGGGPLTPPRLWHRRPLSEPPFYAVEVQPAVTFTMGGLRIDPDTYVLRADGSRIGGLLAAGADTGGTFAEGYGGGLALGSVHGTIAAEVAAQRAGVRMQPRAPHPVPEKASAGTTTAERQRGEKS